MWTCPTGSYCLSKLFKIFQRLPTHLSIYRHRHWSSKYCIPCSKAFPLFSKAIIPSYLSYFQPICNTHRRISFNSPWGSLHLICGSCYKLLVAAPLLHRSFQFLASHRRRLSTLHQHPSIDTSRPGPLGHLYGWPSCPGISCKKYHTATRSFFTGHPFLCGSVWYSN